MTDPAPVPAVTDNRDPIKQWRTRNDQILALHLAGYTSINIAGIIGLSKGRVSQILNDPRMQKAIRMARERMLGGMMVEVQDRMVALGTRAIENIENTVLADIRDKDGNRPVGSKAVSHQDNISFELLSRIGFGRKEESKSKAGGIQLTPEGEQKLIAAMEKAQLARELHKPEDVVDGEFTVEND